MEIKSTKAPWLLLSLNSGLICDLRLGFLYLQKYLPVSCLSFSSKYSNKKNLEEFPRWDLFDSKVRESIKYSNETQCCLKHEKREKHKFERLTFFHRNRESPYIGSGFHIEISVALENHFFQHPVERYLLISLITNSSFEQKVKIKTPQYIFSIICRPPSKRNKHFLLDYTLTFAIEPYLTNK